MHSSLVTKFETACEIKIKRPISLVTNFETACEIKIKRKCGPYTARKTAASKRLGVDLHSVKLPHSLSSDVKQFGFIEEKHSKKRSTYFPIIQLHPLDAPRHVKKKWIAMYTEAQTRKTPWKRLVYKYGSDEYILKPAPDIISFIDGVDKNYDAIPVDIMGILKAGKKLSPAQVGLVEALEILKKEIQRRPNDRVKWLQKNNETMIMPIPKEGRQVAVLEKAHKDHDTDVICIDPSAEMKSVAASGTDDQGIQQIAEAFEI